MSITWPRRLSPVSNATEQATFRLVGILHLPPLPGAPNYTGTPVSAMAEAAVEDAHALVAAGFTHVMLADANDNPQPNTVGPPTIAAMAAVSAAVRGAVALPLGILIGHNDGAAAVAIAHASNAQFIRVKVLTGVSIGPTGWIVGCAMEVAHMRRCLGSDVEVWADVHEATSRTLTGDITWAAAEAISFGGAHSLIVTRDSGVADAVRDIAAVKSVVGSQVTILIGGRVTVATMGEAVGGADGVIVGSALKNGQGPDARVDPAAAKALATAASIGPSLDP